MQRRNLEYFVAVVDCGSISAAAQKLLVAQPSLSRTINAMEKQMDCQLLERTARGVVPTATGRQLYYYARSILDKFQMLERLYHGGEEQLVSRLHVSVALLVLKDSLLENFYHQMNTPDAEICFYETALEPLIEQVSGGQSELGLAVVNDHQLPLFTRMCQARELEVTALDEARGSCVHVHQSHPLAQYEQIQCRQLFEYPRLLSPGDFFSHLNLTVQEEVGRPADTPRRTIVVNSCHTMLRMLRRTPSYVVGNVWQAQELACSGIASIPLSDAPVRQNLVLVRRERQQFSPCAQLFLSDFLQDQGLSLLFLKSPWGVILLGEQLIIFLVNQLIKARWSEKSEEEDSLSPMAVAVPE